jgi:hypothetical protein
MAALIVRRLPDLRTVAIVVGSPALAHLAVFTNLLPRGLIHSHWNSRNAARTCRCGVDVDLARPSAETLWYQTLIPGPSEEPLYRGLALVLLDRAFGDRYWQVLGAPFGLGAIITSLWFGVIHGCGIADGHVVISWITLFVTGLDGFFLAWMRMRTGSLVIPIVAHAIVDVGDSFIG